MASSRNRRLLFRASTAFTAVAVSLFVAELVCRLIVGPPPTATELFVRYDAQLGWSKRPGFEGTRRTSEYTVTERFNERGLRGPLVPFARSPDTFRVLVLGDSHTEGYTVEYRQTFGQVLAHRLEAGRGTPSDVINCGTSGYSTDQELLFYRLHGRAYSADLVVLAFCDNDVWYNGQPVYYGNPKPRFEMVAEDRLALVAPGPPPAADWRTRLRRVASISQLVRMSLDGARRLGRGEFERDGPFSVYVERKTPAVDDAWILTEALLESLRLETRRDGSGLLVFYVASRAVVSDYGQESSQEPWDVHAIRKRLAGTCARLDIALLDPTGELAARSKGDELYFPRDGHWNPRGHSLAGDVLAEWILENVLRGRSPGS